MGFAHSGFGSGVSSDSLSTSANEIADVDLYSCHLHVEEQGLFFNNDGLFLLFHFFGIHPFIGKQERDRADHGDAGKDKPHGLRILCRTGIFVWIGNKALNEETDI